MVLVSVNTIFTEVDELIVVLVAMASGKTVVVEDGVSVVMVSGGTVVIIVDVSVVVVSGVTVVVVVGE